jgi:hypothetical protein
MHSHKLPRCVIFTIVYVATKVDVGPAIDIVQRTELFTCLREILISSLEGAPRCDSLRITCN